MGKFSISSARWIAFEILRKVADGDFSSALLAAEEPNLEPVDRGLCHELVLGVLRWQLNLDKVIEHYAARKTASLDRSVLIALRLGLYQLRFLTRVPASAAVNESVKLVHAARLSSARSFVNAVLRRATREPDYDPGSTEEDPVSKLSITTSHPRWMIERWIGAIGLEAAEAFARANNETPPVAFRIVRAKGNPKELLDKLRAVGIDLEPSAVVQGAWRVSGSTGELRSLAQSGAIYLQDEASQLVAELVEAQANDFVLDLCAAPGGKTTMIADREPESHVLACDVSARRLSIAARAVAVQQLKNVWLFLLDGSKALPFQPGSFDRVLVDAPCSGTGTLRHNPEIRWRLAEADLGRLSIQQVALLQNAAEVLKPGGRLIYSTCSVEREENEDVVAEFLRRNDQMRLVPLRGNRDLTTSSGTLRTWPQRHGTDGFFVAAFKKI